MRSCIRGARPPDGHCEEHKSSSLDLAGWVGEETHLLGQKTHRKFYYSGLCFFRLVVYSFGCLGILFASAKSTSMHLFISVFAVLLGQPVSGVTLRNKTRMNC